MRDLGEFKKHRRNLDGFDNDDPQGGFFVFGINGSEMRLIVANGYGWDHVSVSFAHRCPTWEEMEWVRRKFFKPEEFAFQYHAPLADYVDGSMQGNCRTCLHMWRPHEAENFPVPPKWMVGGMSESEAEFQRLMYAADRREKGLPL